MSATDYPSKHMASILQALEKHPMAMFFGLNLKRFAELPSYLGQLVDVCFFSSLYQEEGRRVCFSLAFHDWDQVQAAGSPDLLVFDTPQSFEPKTLAKLAPSADPGHVYMMVDTATDKSLIVKGLVYDAAAMRTASRTTGFPTILIRVLRAGVLELEVAQQPVFRYDKGTLHVSMLSFAKIDALAPLTMPLIRPVHLLGIASHILRHGHGGALFVLGEDSHAADSVQSQNLEVRYGCRRQPFSVLKKKCDREPKSPPYSDGDCEQVYAEIANLTAVDGAVLLLSDLSVVGYGVFVRALANEHELRTMGSRHKSAFGFCQQWPNSLALVVSQDGDVTLFVRKNGGGVTQVPHLLTS